MLFPFTSSRMSPHLQEDKNESNPTRPEHQESFVALKHVGAVSVPYSPIVVGGCSFDDGADEKGLVAVHFFLTSHNAEPQTARRVPPQDDVFAVVQMSASEQK